MGCCGGRELGVVDCVGNCMGQRGVVDCAGFGEVVFDGGDEGGPFYVCVWGF